jgi:hypothetical protein
MANKLDKAGQICPGEHFHFSFFQMGKRQIARRPAKHVGHQYNTLAKVHSLYRRADLGAPLIDVILGPDADSLDVILRPHDVLDRGEKLARKIAVRDYDDADHLSPEVKKARNIPTSHS